MSGQLGDSEHFRHLVCKFHHAGADWGRAPAYARVVSPRPFASPAAATATGPAEAAYCTAFLESYGQVCALRHQKEERLREIPPLNAPPQKTEVVLGTVIRDTIRDQLPEFHTAPEWTSRRNTARHQCRDSRGEIQHAIIDDIVSALRRLAPQTPTLWCTLARGANLAALQHITLDTQKAPAGECKYLIILPQTSRRERDAVPSLRFPHLTSSQDLRLTS